MISRRFITLSLLTILAGALAYTAATDRSHAVSSASASATQSIGTYTAGCIRDSAAIPMEGEGFQVIRPGRGRYFANPETIEFIVDLGKRVNEYAGGIILIGDVAQQTGGPMLDEHSSHQTGLDADILYWQHPIALQRSLTVRERENIFPQSVLNSSATGVDDFKWDERIGKIVKTAASYAGVDRIFVNPFIKKKLCAEYPGEQWLAKLRPWYGHDGHFHVRLKCPEGNGSCVPQDPIDTLDTGCGNDLASWFTSSGKIKSKKSSGKSVRPKLPEECITIINGGA
jgi:penicillin-insensitive murein DD-endopeptidase